VDSIPLETGKHVMDWSSILGDFDQDGKMEIVSGGEGGAIDPHLEVYENTIGYRFENVFRDSVPPYRGNAKVFSSKDSDGDGKPEIFLDYGRPTGYYKGVIYLYRWETTGDNCYFRILVDSARTDSGIPWSRSCCGDIDGDGIDEIVWSLGTDVYVYKSTGNDKYERVWHWIPPYYKKWDAIYTQVKVYDMNKNGYGEIIISFYNKDTSPLLDTIQIFEIDTTFLAITSKPSILQSSNLTISPNPFKEEAIIKYRVVSREPISLKVYDISGRLIKTFFRAQSVKPGTHLIKWDGKDNKGLSLPNGVYFLRLETRDSPPLLRKVVIER